MPIQEDDIKVTIKNTNSELSNNLKNAIKTKKKTQVKSILNECKQEDIGYCIPLDDYGYKVTVSAVHYATWYNSSILKLLVEKAPNLVNAKDPYNHPKYGHNTPLYWAAENDKPENIRVLLDSKADINRQNHLGDTALHIAAKKGHLRAITALCESKNLDINLHNNAGDTAAGMAAIEGRHECAEFLQKKGADAHNQLLMEVNNRTEAVLEKPQSPKDKQTRASVLKAARSIVRQMRGEGVQRHQEQQVRVAKGILQQYKNALRSLHHQEKNELGDKLKEAIKNEDTAAIETALQAFSKTHKSLNCIDITEYGYDIHVPALHYAVWKNNAGIINLIANTDISYLDMPDDSDGQTPLYWAAENNRTESAKALITLGANINQRDRFGNTPMHIAAKKGHLECLKTMIECAKENDQTPFLNRINRQGKTMLVIAIEENWPECSNYLLTQNAELKPQSQADIGSYSLHTKEHKITTGIMKRRLGSLEEELVVKIKTMMDRNLGAIQNVTKDRRADEKKASIEASKNDFFTSGFGFLGAGASALFFTETADADEEQGLTITALSAIAVLLLKTLYAADQAYNEGKITTALKTLLMLVFCCKCCKKCNNTAATPANELTTPLLPQLEI